MIFRLSVVGFGIYYYRFNFVWVLRQHLEQCRLFLRLCFDGHFAGIEANLGLLDALELALGLDPSNPDTDGDGVADGDEGALYGTDPLSADTDGDGLTDGNELFAAGSDPLTADTAGTA